MLGEDSCCCLSWALELSWYSSYTQEVLPTVCWVSMLGEDSCCCLSWALELSSHLINSNNSSATLSNLVSPSTSSANLVISKSWWALVSICFPIHAHPEYSTILIISVCSV